MKSRAAPRTRLEDIAGRCAVSISTVSRALAGQPGVRQDLRRRILEEARRVRYPAAAALGGHRVLLAASSAAMTDYGRNQFTWLVLEGLRGTAAANAVEIVPVALPDADGDFAALDAGLGDVETRGVLLLTVDDPRVLNRVHAAGLPTVLVNADDPWMRMSSVSPCNRSAARLAADHLLDLGHRDVGFVMRPGRTTIQRRLEGWHDALRARRLPCRDDRVVRVDDWVPELAEQAVGAFLDGPGRGVTALLCAGDSLAVGALAAIKARGLTAPGDVSLVGIDDLPITEFLQPRLTTMHIPARELGATALELLQDLMVSNASTARRIELACRLVVRDSTAPLS